MAWQDGKEYDGRMDAEALLETVLQRKNWTVPIRDALAEKLVLIADGKPLRAKGKRRSPEKR